MGGGDEWVWQQVARDNIWQNKLHSPGRAAFALQAHAALPGLYNNKELYLLYSEELYLLDVA